jgi:ATP-dependent RNA helicase DDX51/DBP6
MDLPNVAHVISYDVPLDMRKYVHRVGRTARAGRDGIAWTLVEDQEANYFKTILRNGGHAAAVQRVRVKEADFAPYRDAYTVSTTPLSDIYQAADGIQKAMAKLKIMYSRED